MRNFVSAVLLFFFILTGCETHNSTGYIITAYVDGLEESTVIYLNRVIDGKMHAVDSATLKDSKVKFDGSLEVPEMIYLNIGGTRKAVNIFCENSEITITANADSLDKAIVNGSSIHDELIEFTEYMKPLDQKYQELRERYQEVASRSDQEEMEVVIGLFDDLRAEQADRIKDFVASKSDSYISPFIIRNYLAYDMEVSDLERIVSLLDSGIHDATEYEMLSQRVETLKSVEIGQPAVDFALMDTTGNPIAISSFRGKILLIDFWASWCGPCRRENPNVVQLYNDFSSKGFEIIGVSFDESRDRWIKAIQDDGLVWPHVSDLKGWQSEAGKLYAITAIPATVLLDREGVIVAKNLRVDDLRAKLEELYAAEAANI